MDTAPRQTITFSRRPTREEDDRLHAGIEMAVAGNNGEPLTCFTLVEEWYVKVSLQMLQKQEHSPPAA